MAKKLRRRLVILLMIIGFIYLNNTSYLVRPTGEKPLLVAHRGMHQTFPMAGIAWNTNTARRIYPPEHPYLENTIPSMAAAFAAGADLVEFDIQLTKDGQFAVFHDGVLEYRTNGQGAVRDYTMAELKKLDIGYGYTADQGQTFPFRGQGVGLMPTLDEVLTHFPDRAFLIHVKSGDPKEGEVLAEYLKHLPAERLAQLTVYGGAQPIAVLQERLPHLRVMSLATMKKALLSYLALGWTGYVPPAIRNTQLQLPLKYARFLWGWPHRFLARMHKANTRVILVLGDGRWSEGFDTLEDLEQLPPNYTGGIWTNRIDRIAPALRAKGKFRAE